MTDINVYCCWYKPLGDELLKWAEEQGITAVITERREPWQGSTILRVTLSMRSFDDMLALAERFDVLFSTSNLVAIDKSGKKFRQR